MREYVRDDERDVWERRGSDMWAWGGLFLSYAELEDDYGPLTPCDSDGEPLNPAPADDVRALLADAFDGLEAQMRKHPPFSMAQTPTDAIMSQAAGWVREWAAATAAGLRS